MSGSSPSPMSPITELGTKFKPRIIVKKSSDTSTTPGRLSRLPYTSPTFSHAEQLPLTAPTRGSVPPLTTIALESLVKGFTDRPVLEGVPARFATAIAAKLPLDADITVTAPNIDDEVYWRRVCLEYKRWTRCEISEHGGSWKQLFLERNIAEMLENFGLYAELPQGYEEDFCRPAIDSTHPAWSTLYPKTKAIRADKRPVRERFGRNSIAEPDLDRDIATSGESGWPLLERLKEISRASFAEFKTSYAWASVDKSEFKTADSAPDGTTASTSATKPGAIVNPLLLPFSMAAEYIRNDEEVTTQRADDEVDSRMTGEQLREFVPLSVLDEFKKTAKWPTQRGGSVLAVRHSELQALLSRIQAAADSVFALQLEQLPSHIDLELIMSRLPNLTSLTLSYGMRHLGMKYERSLFGMRITDAESLARCVRITDTLTSLSLPCNMIDDNLLMVIMAGLLDNRTITHLDLSHNNITSAGVQLIAKLLRPPSAISSLNLTDNKIDEKAGKHLAKALRGNECLTELGLRLNDLGDEGGKAILDALQTNTCLTTLNLSSNRLGAGTAAMAANLLANPSCVLCSLDLTGNLLDESDAQILHSAVMKNSTITSLDLRNNTGIVEASEHVQGIFHATRKNEVVTRLSHDLSYR